ncbi:MAG: glycoside hydrolase family 47 protein [Flavobacteriales bacterium]|nr:glycoside hydrolase family 47 protein [Flavobacteriales bacterium]
MATRPVLNGCSAPTTTSGASRLGAGHDWQREVRAGDYDLNPEIVESAYYLYHFTGKPMYREMAVQYWGGYQEALPHGCCLHVH